jgi:hypothetical protein
MQLYLKFVSDYMQYLAVLGFHVCLYMHAIVLEIPVWLCEVVLVANLWLHDGYMPLYISLMSVGYMHQL